MENKYIYIYIYFPSVDVHTTDHIAPRRFTRDCGGYAFLYADTFMNRAEFEEMFDLTAYEVVREKYFASNAFPHLYDKVRVVVEYAPL